jgi:hypothetical protein
VIVVQEVHGEIDLEARLNLFTLHQRSARAQQPRQDLPLTNDTYSSQIPLHTTTNRNLAIKWAHIPPLRHVKIPLFVPVGVEVDADVETGNCKRYNVADANGFAMYRTVRD